MGRRCGSPPCQAELGRPVRSCRSTLLLGSLQPFVGCCQVVTSVPDGALGHGWLAVRACGQAVVGRLAAWVIDAINVKIRDLSTIS